MSSEAWLKTIQNAKKTAFIQDNTRKVKFLFEDGREMLEEYNMDTNVVTLRAWKEKNNFGNDIGWSIEIGPIPKTNIPDTSGIQDLNAPFILRSITKKSLKWQIGNLSYPKDVYSVTAEEDGTITVRTSNKKYFKKLEVPDLKRIGLKPEQEHISFTHQYHALVITYKKPQALLDVEDKILAEVLQLDTESENDKCPIS